MFDEQDREPLLGLDLLQRLGQGGGLGPVEPGGRLVEQQDLGLGHQRPTDLDETALAEAEPLDRLVGEVREPQQLEHLVAPGDLVGRGPAQAEQVLPEAAVAAVAPARRRSRWSRTVESGNSSMRWNVRPMPRRARWWTGRRVMSSPSSSTGAAVDAQHAEHAVEERGLAGTVRTDQPDPLALADLDARPRSRATMPANFFVHVRTFSTALMRPAPRSVRRPVGRRAPLRRWRPRACARASRATSARRSRLLVLEDALGMAGVLDGAEAEQHEDATSARSGRKPGMRSGSAGSSRRSRP